MQVLETTAANNAPVSNQLPLIRTVALSKSFKKALAVNKINLEVEAGDVFGLLGPNGAGKTTLMRMLLGMVAPDEGQVEVFGYNPLRQRAQVLARTAAIVEAPALYPGLTGRDNLRAIAKVNGLDEPARINRVLDTMGLTSYSGNLYRTYSLGMKQRLCIAAALLTEPQLIILDEPTNGLDPAGMAEIRQLLKELVAQGRTVLLCSHLLNEVQQVCNRVAIIQRGQLIAQGLVSDLLASQSFIQIRVAPTEYTQTWQIFQQQGWADHTRLEEDYFVLHNRIALRGATVNQALATKGIFASEITPRTLSLEEYYLKLTNQPENQS